MAVTEEARPEAVPASTTITAASLARDWAQRAPHRWRCARRTSASGRSSPGSRPVGHDRATPATRCSRSASNRATGWRSTPRTVPSGSSSTSPPSRSAASRSGSTRPTRRPRSSTCSPTAAPRSTSPRTRSRSTRCSRSTHRRRTCERSSSSSRAACSAPYDDRLSVLGRLPRARARAPQRTPGSGRASGWPRRTPDDIMTLVYTSGTTGPPKGAMLTNANCGVLLRHARQLAGARARGGPPGPDDLILTYLPLCHVAERIFSTWTIVGAGRGAQLRRVDRRPSTTNLREVQPTIFFAVPRIWEKLHAGVAASGRATPAWFKRAILRFGLRPASRIGKKQGRPRRRPHRWRRRLCYAVGWVLVLPGRCASGSVCAGAATPRRVRRRSRPRCSSSSWASACRSTSSTA